MTCFTRLIVGEDLRRHSVANSSVLILLLWQEVCLKVEQMEQKIFGSNDLCGANHQ